MNHLNRRWKLLFALAMGLTFMPLLGGRASAQTGPDLMVKPWPDKGQISDGTGDAYIFDSSHIKRSNESFRLDDYESSGRFRLLPGNEISPRIGYDILFLDNHTTSRRIPNQLSDESVAFGTGVAKWGNGWVAAVTVGVGYAGSSAFDLGRGWYGKADIIIAREISDTDALGIVLDYDGNRAYLPDVPLPGVGYSHRFDPNLSVVAGIPFSTLDWKPFPHLQVNATYQLFSDFKASVGYEFLPHLFAYGAYSFVRDSFQADGYGHNRRLLFFQRRMEAGLRYVPIDNFTAKLGVGYGWDGSFRSGFDFQNDNFVADLSDAVYLRAGIEWKF